MLRTEQDIAAFVQAWCARASTGVMQLLSLDFAYDDGLGRMNRDDFVEQWPHLGPAADVEIINTVLGGSKVAVLYESTDSVTNLRHRSSMHLAMDGERVARIFVVTRTIP